MLAEKNEINQRLIAVENERKRLEDESARNAQLLQNTESERIRMEREIERMNHDDIRRNRCIVCFEDNSAAYAPLPCGHRSYCQNCILSLNHTCLVCRQNFYNYERIFLN